MKNLKILSSIFSIFLLIGCNNDDDNNSDSVLNGKWKLVEVNGTIAGITDEFEPGTITWTFNPSNHSFTVVNNNTDSSLMDIFDSGIYDYSVLNANSTQSCAQTVTLDETDYGCIILTNTTLQINQGEADGIIIKLIR